MRSRISALVIMGLLTAVSGLVAQSPARSTYLTPPKVVVDILDAAPAPTVSVSPDRRTIALAHRRSMPAIGVLAQPIHRLAGSRINPKTNGPQQRTAGTNAIAIKSIVDGTERTVTVPANANIGNISFAPDGRRLAFVNTTETAMELWIADTSTAQATARTCAT